MVHTVSLLTNGKVLAMGGLNVSESKSTCYDSAELYDPFTETWKMTGRMNSPRINPVASILSNGKVLVNGGLCISSNGVGGAELYDPSTETWTDINSMHIMRDAYTQSVLPNGQVLVTGGTSILDF